MQGVAFFRSHRESKSYHLLVNTSKLFGTKGSHWLLCNDHTVNQTGPSLGEKCPLPRCGSLLGPLALTVNVMVAEVRAFRDSNFNWSPWLLC